MSKREIIVETAARLFATQGFEATTTIQITREAGVTEPLLYYHFKGKDDLFTRIIEASFAEYFLRIDALEKTPASPFGQIQNLIELQYDTAEEMPNESRLVARACPARLNDPQDICTGNVKEYRRRLLGYLARSISEGIGSGSFEQVPVEETAILILSVIDGIVHYSRMNRNPKKNLKKAAVDFCRRSLMIGDSG
jgi:AcrR family transcriptional regulator